MMEHAECKDCILNSHRGFHFEMDGVTTCDQYGDCMFFKSKEKQGGDLISREALINAKPEFMNEKVVRDTKYQTTKDRIYAKAWNACNSYWLDTIKNALTVEINTNDVEHKACCKGLEDGRINDDLISREALKQMLVPMMTDGTIQITDEAYTQIVNLIDNHILSLCGRGEEE